MKSSSSSLSSTLQHRFHHCCRRERCLVIFLWRLVPFLLSFVGVTTLFGLLVFYPPCNFKPMAKRVLDLGAGILQRQKDDETCDLFKGRWVPDLSEPLYTDSNCKTIPSTKNCFLQGRKDRDFLNWRWKPDGCELPRFDPRLFLKTVRGKTMAFVGDSVARNQMESLLCLLSQVETPVDAYKDKEDRFRTWVFPSSQFMLMILWSKFLLAGEERMINGSWSGIYDLHLDRVDENWAKDLPTVDYAIISAGHWFFRKIYLHEAGKVTGCVYCTDPNVTNHDPDFAVRATFGSVLGYVNDCRRCRKGMVTLVRTFSPAHFENGTWNTGGSCGRSRPFGAEEVQTGGFEWGLRSIQVEEVEKTRNKKKGKKRFGVVDITRAMQMRPDGHPGAYWGNKWMKGYNDCVHWCLPGPVDVWNQFLMAVIRDREVADS